MDSQEIANVLDNSQEENLMQGFFRGQKKIMKCFYTL